jgi:hypothetical protein
MPQNNQNQTAKTTPQLFDVIVGNPPYVRHEQISEIKEYLSKHYEVYTSTADLYVYFFERALKLLKPGGYLGYIVSNKFTRASYGKNLRKWILDNFTIISYVDDFGQKVFEDAVVDPCVIVIKKETAPENHKIIYNKTEKVLQSSLSENGWSFVSEEVFELKRKIEENSTPLKNLDVKINYGIKTGFNEAFIIDEETKKDFITKDPKNAEIIKPLLRGRDIDRYKVDFADQYLIVAKNGIDIFKDYPTIAEFFEEKNVNSGGKMEKRWDKGDHWMNLRHCAYYDDFEKPKIVWTDMAQEPSFILDEKSFYMNNTVYFLNGSINLNFLLGVLNSHILKTYFDTIASNLGEKGKRYFKQFVEVLPIPKATPDQQAQIAELVDKIMDLKKEQKELVTKFIKTIDREYNPKNISKKIEEFWKLDFGEFLTELEKQKVQLSLNKKEELQDYFEDKKTKVLELETQINQIDEQIEGVVKGLYGV